MCNSEAYGVNLCCAQARAHALLKTKETELRSAREEVRAENAAELARAFEEAATAARELHKVRRSDTSFIAIFWVNI